MRVTVFVCLVCCACLCGSATLVLGSIGCGGGSPPPTGPGPECTTTLDQSGLGGSELLMFGIGVLPQDVGQTITTSRAGRLVSLSVLRLGYLTGLGPLQLEVRRVLPSGLPDDSVAALLGTVSVDVASLPTEPSTVSFDLEPLGINVAAGQQLAFVMRANGTEMTVDTSTADNYAGGEAVQFITDPPQWTVGEGPDLGFGLYICSDL